MEIFNNNNKKTEIEIENLKTENATLNNNISDLAEKNRAHEKAIFVLKGNIDSLQQKLKHAEERLEKYSRIVGTLQIQNESLQRANKALLGEPVKLVQECEDFAQKAWEEQDEAQKRAEKKYKQEVKDYDEAIESITREEEFNEMVKAAKEFVDNHDIQLAKDRTYKHDSNKNTDTENFKKAFSFREIVAISNFANNGKIDSQNDRLILENVFPNITMGDNSHNPIKVTVSPDNVSEILQFYKSSIKDVLRYAPAKLFACAQYNDLLGHEKNYVLDILDEELQKTTASDNEKEKLENDVQQFIAKAKAFEGTSDIDRLI